MKYKGIVISDEHFGVMDSKKLMHEHTEIIFQHMKTMKKLDFIVITGDFFDHNLYLNDEATAYAVLCMKNFVYFAKKFHAKIRIVYGTESHECGQYKIFKSYEEDSDIDFKVINHVTEEELFPGMMVLYVPEEYIYSKSEYYKEFFEKESYYDYIFGHGIIQEAMSNAVKNMKRTKENTRAKIPVFSSGELSYACKGKVYFGHYHVHTNINDKVFYVGSFSRWIFGEEEEKGFYIIEKDDKNYHEEFIINSYADKYKTISFGYENLIFLSMDKFKEKMDSIDKLIETNIYQHIRLIFNIPENYENPEFLINYIRERFKFNDKIKIEIVNGYIDKKKKIDREKLETLSKKYSIIFDRNIPIEEKYSFFIKDRNGVELTSDKIKQYLECTDIIKLGREN